MAGVNKENEKYNRKNDGDESCFFRFMSKKYKCVIIWLISIISVSEAIYLTLQQPESSSIKTILLRYLNVTNDMFLDNKIK